MNQEQASSRLAPIFHEDFRQLCQTYLTIDEEILGVSDCCASHSVGYFVATSLRSILVWYEDPPPPLFGHLPFYYDKEMQFDGSKWRFYWRPPPVTPLAKANFERRRIDEGHHSKLKRVEIKNFEVKHERQTVQLVGLICFGSSFPLFSSLTFRAEGGQEIYNVLLKCLRGEFVPKASSSNSQLITELERLSALYKQGLLSSEQFEAAKNKLLKESA